MKITKISIYTGIVGINIGLINWLLTKDISLLLWELLIVIQVTIETYFLERLYRK